MSGDDKARREFAKFLRSPRLKEVVSENSLRGTDTPVATGYSRCCQCSCLPKKDDDLKIQLEEERRRRIQKQNLESWFRVATQGFDKEWTPITN